MASRSPSWPNPSGSVQANPPMPTHPATRPTTWQSLLARSWCVGSSGHVATQSTLLEFGRCALTFSYGRKSSNPSWMVSPGLIADRPKSSPPWINIISNSAKSFTKPLKQLACSRLNHKPLAPAPQNGPSGRQHVVVHASVRGLVAASHDRIAPMPVSILGMIEVGRVPYRGNIARPCENRIRLLFNRFELADNP